MISGSWMPVAVLATSLVTALVIFALREERVVARTVLNLAGAVAKLALVAWIFAGHLSGERHEWRLAFLPGADLVLRVDLLALLFVSLSAVLWLVTTVYAIAYLEGAPHRSRFFGFFGLCVTATMGIARAGILVTFVVFYELLTVVTYPLVVHRGTEAARAAGRRYLAYTVGGGLALLVGAVWLHVLAGTTEFRPGGVVGDLADEHRAQVTAIFVLLVIGVGVKAALVPLHGWLPRAMVAPAPVSALLHAVAVVKAGAYGLVRVVYDLVGVQTAADLGLLGPLAAVAAITIVYGSVRALAATELKERLAWSTVSQVSYIALGVGLLGPLATTAAVAHLVHQGVMKITLFFCAGAYAETTGAHRIDELAGLGRRMPLTSALFAVGALGMIGLPPMAGFATKWWLGQGALEAGQPWVLGVLAISTLLNAAYFLPVLRTLWLEPREGPPGICEATPGLVAPAVVTAILAVLAGALAASDLSAVEAAATVAEELYAP